MFELGFVKYRVDVFEVYDSSAWLFPVLGTLSWSVSGELCSVMVLYIQNSTAVNIKRNSRPISSHGPTAPSPWQWQASALPLCILPYDICARTHTHRCARKLTCMHTDTHIHTIPCILPPLISSWAQGVLGASVSCIWSLTPIVHTDLLSVLEFFSLKTKKPRKVISEIQVME